MRRAQSEQANSKQDQGCGLGNLVDGSRLARQAAANLCVSTATNHHSEADLGTCRFDQNLQATERACKMIVPGHRALDICIGQIWKSTDTSSSELKIPPSAISGNNARDQSRQPTPRTSGKTLAVSEQAAADTRIACAADKSIYWLRVSRPNNAALRMATIKFLV